LATTLRRLTKPIFEVIANAPGSVLSSTTIVLSSFRLKKRGREQEGLMFCGSLKADTPEADRKKKELHDNGSDTQRQFK